MLILIYYYKNVVSFSDIEELFSPLSEKHFSAGSRPELSEIYREIFSLEEEKREQLKQDVTAKFKDASRVFSDAPEEDRDMLQRLDLICQLCADIYLRKLLIEKLVDEVSEAPQTGKTNKGR
jgi:hypothetical protein